MNQHVTPHFDARRIPQSLRARFEAALKADVERLLWMEDSVLPRSDHKGAVREALKSAYRTLARFHGSA